MAATKSRKGFFVYVCVLVFTEQLRALWRVYARLLADNETIFHRNRLEHKQTPRACA